MDLRYDHPPVHCPSVGPGHIRPLSQREQSKSLAVTSAGGSPVIVRGSKNAAAATVAMGAFI